MTTSPCQQCGERISGWKVASGLALATLWMTLCACGGATPEDGGASGGRGSPSDQNDAVVLAAPARVEGVTETVEVGAGMDGVLVEVPVKEGDHVMQGDVLARLECEDLEARMQVAQAEETAFREARRRLLRGSRDEERRVAAAQTHAAEARLTRARERHERLARLKTEGSMVSEDDLDEAERDLGVAKANLVAAEEHERLVNAPPLPEEIARADAQVRGAAQRVAEAEARLDRCTVRAPVGGTVLRRHLQPGEQVSLAFPRPIVSLADTSRFRIRAEVDERDLGRVSPGQAVAITADALGDRRLHGRVTRLGGMMGRKKVRTGDPAEKSDRDVLEVWIDLDEGDPLLVVDLRVTALFLE